MSEIWNTCSSSWSNILISKDSPCSRQHSWETFYIIMNGPFSLGHPPGSTVSPVTGECPVGCGAHHWPLPCRGRNRHAAACSAPLEKTLKKCGDLLFRTSVEVLVPQAWLTFGHTFPLYPNAPFPEVTPDTGQPPVSHVPAHTVDEFPMATTLRFITFTLRFHCVSCFSFRMCFYLGTRGYNCKTGKNNKD